MLSDEIYISISDFFVDMPHTQQLIDDTFDLLPDLFASWTEYLWEDDLLQVYLK